jgi:hypothetical protein
MMSIRYQPNILVQKDTSNTRIFVPTTVNYTYIGYVLLTTINNGATFELPILYSTQAVDSSCIIPSTLHKQYRQKLYHTTYSTQAV